LINLIFYVDEDLIRWGWPEDVWYVNICLKNFLL